MPFRARYRPEPETRKYQKTLSSSENKGFADNLRDCGPFEFVTAGFSCVCYSSPEATPAPPPMIAPATAPGPPLKASDQLGWISRMNSIRHRVEEILLDELVFA